MEIEGLAAEISGINCKQQLIIWYRAHLVVECSFSFSCPDTYISIFPLSVSFWKNIICRAYIWPYVVSGIDFDWTISFKRTRGKPWPQIERRDAMIHQHVSPKGVWNYPSRVLVITHSGQATRMWNKRDGTTQPGMSKYFFWHCRDRDLTHESGLSRSLAEGHSNNCRDLKVKCPDLNHGWPKSMGQWDIPRCPWISLQMSAWPWVAWMPVCAYEVSVL